MCLAEERDYMPRKLSSRVQYTQERDLGMYKFRIKDPSPLEIRGGFLEEAFELGLLLGDYRVCCLNRDNFESERGHY